MKQITISVPENKLPFFMKLMKSLNFVKVIEPAQSLEDQLTPGQRKTWESIKQGFVELKLHEEGKLEFRPIEDLINEL